MSESVVKAGWVCPKCGRRFAKVNLEPGESRTLNFKLRREDLSFIGSDNKPVLEPGDFEVRVAGLTQKFTVK